MKILTNDETKLIDDFILRNNISNFDVAMFNVVISNIFPMWRTEHVLREQVNTNGISLAYIQYVKGLHNDYSRIL